MKYYAVRYRQNSNEDGCILWNTESESKAKTSSLVRLQRGFDYEILSEKEIFTQILNLDPNNSELHKKVKAYLESL